MKKSLTLFFLVFVFHGLFGQDFAFKENKGQWPVYVLFGTDFGNFKTYLTTHGFRYSFYKAEELSAAFASVRDKRDTLHQVVHGHSYEVQFAEADFSKIVKEKKSPTYYNFFLGNDKSKWASQVEAWEKISVNNIYLNTDLIAYNEHSAFKYDWKIKPGGAVSKINMQFKFTDGLEIKNGNLIIKTSAGEVTEQKPYAYQVVNGQKKAVACNFVFTEENTIGFAVSSYDKTKELIIDPVVLACSYGGSGSWSYSSCATYDTAGNIYSGIWTEVGFTVSNGAFQTSFGGVIDCAVSVFNSNGTSKIFSTYIGGDSVEFPCSIKVFNTEVILQGFTQSPDFPISNGAFDNALNGKSDLFITKVDISGSNLLASTFVGGSADESDPAQTLNPYYWQTGSQMCLDNSGQLYVACCTTSPDFPTTSGAHAVTLSGSTDAVFFSMNNSLTALSWSTYIGGSSKDDACSIRPDGNGGAYCLGSTGSANFPATAGAYMSNFNSGQGADLYICHLDNTGTVLNATFFGTAANDNGYHLDINQDHEVYFCGHIGVSSLFTPSPGTFSNNNGENIIAKLDSSLSTLIFQTKFGSTSNTTFPKLFYHAFKVDTCGNIYIAGTGYKYLPVTPNAIMQYQGGYTDVYMAVFNANCASLRFASYYGGTGGPPAGYSIVGEQSWGTSDIDDKGVLYLGFAATSACPVTASAYDTSYTNNTSTPVIYNDLVLKVDFQTFLTASTSYGAATTGCNPYNGTFVNAWGQGTSFWDFGNGSTSTLDSLNHLYPDTGTYSVLLIATDTSTCNKVDSVITQVNVIEPTDFDLGPDVKICVADTVIISGPPALSWLWSSGETTQSIAANQSGNYQLALYNGGCITTDDVNVLMLNDIDLAPFPNVVTANNDNVNDWIDLSNYSISEVDLSIYNRWGNLVLHNSDAQQEVRFDDFAEGTYYYVLSCMSDCSEKKTELRGFITVFR